MSDRLVEWFKRGRKLKAIRMLREQSEHALKCVLNLREALMSALKGEAEKTKGFLEFVKLYEHQADSMHTKILNEVAGGELPPTVRGDVMRLTRQIDSIADWARAGSRLIKILLPEFRDLFENFPDLGGDLQKMMDRDVECAGMVVEAVSLFVERRIESSLKKAGEVEVVERQVDDLNEVARSHVAAIRKLEVGKALLIKDLVDSLENIADMCENACTQLRVTIAGLL